MTEKIKIEILTVETVNQIVKLMDFKPSGPRPDHDAVIHLCEKYVQSLAELKKDLKIGGTELLLLIQYELDVLLRAMHHPLNKLSISDLIKITSIEASATSSTLRSEYRDELRSLLVESSSIVVLQGDVLDKSRISLCQTIMSAEKPPEDAAPLFKVAAASYFALHAMMKEAYTTN